jgi:TRAP-type uncharacterized transport system fused permease subunit
MRLGAPLFILPFMFVLNPALILQGEPQQIVVAVGTALVAIWMLSAGMERYAYFAGPTDRVGSLLMLAGGLTLIVPEGRSDLIGLGLLIAAYGWHFLRGRARMSGR